MKHLQEIFTQIVGFKKLQRFENLIALKFLWYIKFNDMLNQIFSEDQFMLPHLIKFRQTVNKDRSRFAKWFALTLLGSFFLGSVVQDFWGDFLPAVHSPGEGFGRRMKLGRVVLHHESFFRVPLLILTSSIKHWRL